MKSLIIVGGGTTGLTTALILKKRFPNTKITMIKSDKIGILGVGEGTTEHWIDFCNYCELSYLDIIKKCDATVKLGIVFEGFTPEKYIHCVTPVLTNKTVLAQYHAGFAYYISNNINQTEMSDQNILVNKIHLNHFVNKTSPSNQFHFNTFKLNEHLVQICKERDINIITDDILEVNLNETGYIKNIKGKINNYTSDFFIDCTGFQKILISKLGAKWQSYKKYLKMNEAIAFPTKDTEEYPLYTKIKAMSSGWIWRTPVYGRWGNGYVYDNNYINADQAKKEVESVLKHDIEIFKNVKFDPGCLDRPWIKNCLALGISASFVEPLEASTISVSINQTFLLTHLLENYNENDIKEYNNKTKHIMENIRDFVFIHYLSKKNDTQFWKNIKDVEMPETLKFNMEKWQYRLPIEEDFKETYYYVFWPANFISVMYGLNLFNKKNIKKEYLSYSKEIRTYVENCIKQEKEEYKLPRINHKEYLQLIKNENSINK